MVCCCCCCCCLFACLLVSFSAATSAAAAVVVVVPDGDPFLVRGGGGRASSSAIHDKTYDSSQFLENSMERLLAVTTQDDIPTTTTTTTTSTATTTDNNEKKVAVPQQPTRTTTQVQEQSKSSSQRKKKTKSSTAVVPTKIIPGGQESDAEKDNNSNNDDDDDDDDDNHHRQQEHVENNDDDDDALQVTDEANTKNTVDDSSVNDDDDDDTSAEEETTNTRSSISTTVSRRGTAVPNPVFRFLLHRGGRIGQALIMIIALWLEFLDLYVPAVSYVLDWIYVHSLPKSIREPPSYRHHRQQGRRRRRQTPVSAAAAASTLMARTGTSRKKRNEFTRQADEIALQQLKALGTNAIYRHTTVAFQKRHSLGPFRSTTTHEPTMIQQQQFEDDEPNLTSSNQEITSGLQPRTDSTGTTTLGKMLQQMVSPKAASGAAAAAAAAATASGKKKKPKPKDWVVQALTEDRKTCSPKLRPTLAIALGSQGPKLTVGLELFDSGALNMARDEYRRSVIQVVTQPPPKPRVSSRTMVTVDSSSSRTAGIMDRIRAAAGSTVSRSILGAYPGDVTPYAADPHGLWTMAERYDYSNVLMEHDDNDHDHDSIQKMTKRVKKRPTRSKAEEASHTTDSMPSKTLPRKRTSLLPGLNDDEMTSTRRSSPYSSSSSKAGANQRRSSFTTTTTTPRKTLPSMRPTNQRLQELRSRTHNSLPRPSSSSSSSSIRPAMETIQELRERQKRKSDGDSADTSQD